VLEFLSAEWFARFAAELARVEPVAGAPPLALGQVLTGAPHGDVAYTVLVDDERAELVLGSTDRAAVTLVEDWTTARAIAAGSPVSELLAAGRITLLGDANALLAGQAQFEVLNAALDALQAETRT
jgi:hypothetical protein